MRPSFEKVFLNMATELAKRSSCSRLQVASIVTDSTYRHILSIGYNGSAPGKPNKCKTNIPGKCGCRHDTGNLIRNDNSRWTGRKKLVFSTHSPCLKCAKLLVKWGNVISVTYLTEYRDTTGLQFLKKNDILVKKYGSKHHK